MLEYNKNYTTLALNCILKNSKRMISASRINKRIRLEHIKLLKELL